MKYIAALDQGTTSSRTVIFDESANIVAQHNIEFEQLYPHPGWVEHRPEDILRTQIESLRLAVRKSGIHVGDLVAIGITNQRETTLLWDRATGKPLCNAIVWQCRRTAPLVERLKQDGLGNVIRDRTGLVPDAYFSGTKLQWILDTIPGARARAEKGELCFGTVDSFLAWNLTTNHVHVTDATNAARTMLYNIYEQRWDETLLRAMDIPPQILPEVVDSAQVVGKLDSSILGREIPLAAMAGDQHAALFGQGCFTPGMCKNTYGTGCFVLMNTGKTPVKSQHNLITTVAWRIDGQPRYALEGSVFVGGAVVQWLRDEIRLIANAAESEAVAAAIPDNGDVYFVPAFTGLGAPYWDMYGRGTIVGLTRGSGRAHIVRAALESIAYQSADVISAMNSDFAETLSQQAATRDPAARLEIVRVDGGASANNFLMQFQADILNARVVRPRVIETTGKGAAMLAGLATGVWTVSDLYELGGIDREFTPAMDEARRTTLNRRWHRAVERAKSWAEEDGE